MRPWHDWYHCTAHTYGSWLRGDPRGWRSRHHREHVDGDYKNPPPPGKYAALYEYSRSLMKRDSVKLDRELRQFVLDSIIQKLLQNQIETAIGSLDAIHLHVLTRCPDHNPRHWLGLAKKHASHCVRALNILPPGGLWSKRSHPEPITGPAHYAKAFDYIHDHIDRGAVVWEPNVAPVALANGTIDIDLDAMLLD